MKHLVLSAILLAACLTQASCKEDSRREGRVPDNFEIGSFLGTWYEIARFDHKFERGMSDVTAEYSLRPDGKIRVLNSGIRDGQRRQAEGKAKYPDPKGKPWQLKVSFFLFFYSDYDILYIEDDLSAVLIGSSSDKYLWLMSRTPRPSDEVVGRLLEEARLRGYDTEKLIWVGHDNTEAAL